ncbi:hypothetical protein LDO26_10370 [Luteimonas sp. BDR2-5]|uniref:hypothetical protein n=1 Tax=Proluteimonas luteida TaxID=2878685 RepID=UPI001E412CC6|nr:hypothetical protein [Luteimonas sp. BDR2-5]MCD9028610.1 hypothetical protein [Luteimonas sp. BDR2-5]
MSHQPEPVPAADKPPSAAARYLVVFAVGLLVGIVAVVMLLRAIEGRKTWEDRYPHAVMQLYQAHLAQLSGNVDANRCAPTDNLVHLQAMRALGNDLEPAFPDLRDNRGFVAAAGQMRRTLDAALASPPLNCTSLGTAVKQIGESCGACHQDFRG